MSLPTEAFPLIVIIGLLAAAIIYLHKHSGALAQLKSALGVVPNTNGTSTSTAIAAVHEAVVAAVAAPVVLTPTVTTVAAPTPSVLTPAEIATGVFQDPHPGAAPVLHPIVLRNATSPGYWTIADAQALGITKEQAETIWVLYCQDFTLQRPDLTLAKAYAWYKTLGTGNQDAFRFVGEPAKA